MSRRHEKTCDVCGSKHGVRAVSELDAKPTVAAWIREVCSDCQRRLRRPDVVGTARS